MYTKTNNYAWNRTHITYEYLKPITSFSIQIQGLTAMLTDSRCPIYSDIFKF